MSDYVILTDSSCDLPAKTAEELGVSVVPLSVNANDVMYVNYLDEREISFHDFYDILRQKNTATTSAANISDFTGIIEPFLRDGKDVLYLGFSSALSSTFSAGFSAAAEFSERYPERKVYTVDTLCASLGEGLLVYLAVMEQRKGKTIEEVRDFAESTRLKVCHWFTVEDLHHLKRGGRLSAASATLGTMLHIKPVLHVDNEGRLVSVEKVRGRRASIQRLAAKAAELAENLSGQTVFISHGDCPEEAETLAQLIRSMGVTDIIINHVGPVIGAHSGPGTLALFFIGRER